MPEHDVRGDRAVYDHETEDPRGARRRRVADWGVGEEIFDRMPSPRRRFARGGEGRRESHPRDRHEPTAPRDEVAPPPPREQVAPPRRADVVPAPREDVAPPPPREGRRTVVIRGPSAPPAVTPARRHRPPRTALERPRPPPDRTAPRRRAPRAPRLP